MPQPHSRKAKSTGSKPLSSWYDALWLLQFMYQRLTYWGNNWLCQTAGHFWERFQLQIPMKPESQWRCSVVWKRTIGSPSWHKALLIPSREDWSDLSFTKDAWLQPRFKTRSAPTHWVWILGPLTWKKIARVGMLLALHFHTSISWCIKSNGCVTCGKTWLVFLSLEIICDKGGNSDWQLPGSSHCSTLRL